MQSTILGTTHAIAKTLSEFWLPHLTRTEDLFTHLEYVDQSSKEIRAEALKMELVAFDDMLKDDIPSDWVFKEYRYRTIITLVGKITYMRRIYKEPSGICHAYLDEILGIRTRFKLAPDAFIWIVKMAADISFRKTAKAFFERTGAKISHWLVMACVREEGILILRDLYARAFGSEKASAEGKGKISSETLFAEFDGIHIALQKTKHEKLKPRWEYELGRKKVGFELKAGCFYAGKNDKGERVGCAHFVLDGSPEYFWPLFNARIASVYDISDIETVHSSADAAGWCKNHDLEVSLTATSATHHLDLFHLNQECYRTFGGYTKESRYFIRLAFKKRVGKMLGDLDRIIAHADNRKRYLKFKNYLISNRALIETGHGPSMGTMEGSNAHVYAARMKVWGGGWSRLGAACMAAVRARIHSGEALIVPKSDNVLYDNYQIARRQSFAEKQFVFNHTILRKEGKGWEPPRGSVALTTLYPRTLQGMLGHYASGSNQIN